MDERDESRLKPRWWAALLVLAIVLVVAGTLSAFAGTFRSYVPATLTSDRAGLVMERGAKVKLRGVQVGRVGDIHGGRDAVSLALEIDPDQVQYIPANVEARIRATTAFGAKYVDLIVPKEPVSQRLRAGAVIRSDNVSTEVNTVFQNLTGVLRQIDPAKLNGVLTALGDGLRGQAQDLGEAITDGNQVLQQLNPRADAVRRDWQSLKGFADTYGAAAQNIVTVLDAASTTSQTITDNDKQLDAVLLSVTGLSNKGIELLGPNKDNLVQGINLLEPTTALGRKYSPELACTLMGGKNVLDFGFTQAAGGLNGKSAIVDAALLFGDDPYRYPENLPIYNAKGGAGGQPGNCGSLPDVAKNWPVRQLITDTGYGTGLDNRPNPGIGFPGTVNFLPTTRGNPEPPRVRYDGPPAPGPVPYPGAPAYGAQLYAPDGSPLWPGLPPAPPPGQAPDPGPVGPGTEPFTPPHPAEVQPTPGFPPPVPAVPGQ
jgi:phospholipid/cholesterol/gamma-HCH transport system substrate-binding protein